MKRVCKRLGEAGFIVLAKSAKTAVKSICFIGKNTNMVSATISNGPGALVGPLVGLGAWGVGNCQVPQQAAGGSYARWEGPMRGLGRSWQGGGGGTSAC